MPTLGIRAVRVGNLYALQVSQDGLCWFTIQTASHGDEGDAGIRAEVKKVVDAVAKTVADNFTLKPEEVICEFRPS